ncbi:MAG TPA: division/cell wall cluster transcriptional repressor MraZ [Acetobacteraceae bacterium]|nr:division/cell wall cluster transcriptional repressor MraZ [Acetobacteraceae bacterium]
MSQFWGTHQNKRDGKGRVSIPAPFRTALRDGKDDDPVVTVVLRASHRYACIEGWPVGEFERLASRVTKLDFFSADQEDLATTLYADALLVESDKEGRILLPETLVRHAGLDGAVAFVGLGQIFQIWEPAAAEHRRAEARERARNLTLPQAGLTAASEPRAATAAAGGGG